MRDVNKFLALCCCGTKSSTVGEERVRWLEGVQLLKVELSENTARTSHEGCGDSGRFRISGGCRGEVVGTSGGRSEGCSGGGVGISGGSDAISGGGDFVFAHALSLPYLSHIGRRDGIIGEFVHGIGEVHGGDVVEDGEDIVDDVVGYGVVEEEVVVGEVVVVVGALVRQHPYLSQIFWGDWLVCLWENWWW